MNQTETVVIHRSELFDPNTKPSFGTYLSQLWSRRSFVLADAKARAFQEQREYILGRLWLVVQPVIRAALYGAVFGLLLQTSRNIDNFIGYLFIGITFFGLITRMTTAGSGLVRAQKSLFVSFNFPRASIVLSRSVRSAFDSIIPAVTAIAVALVAQWGEPLHWTMIFVLPLLCLLLLFGSGLMLISARITAFFPDARVIIALGCQAWFYLSCIFYSISRFDHVPVARTFVEYNPGYRFIEAMRDCVLYGNAPSASTWLMLFGWSCLLFIVGLAFFWQAEERYIEVR